MLERDYFPILIRTDCLQAVGNQRNNYIIYVNATVTGSIEQLSELGTW